MRERDEPRPRPDLRQDRGERALVRQVADPRHAHAGAGRVQRPEQAEVLDVRRDHLVLGSEIEAREDDVAGVRRRRRERDELGLDADDARERFPGPRAPGVDRLVVRLPAAPVDELALGLRNDRLHRRARERPVRARVQVRDPFENRKRRARLLERHWIVSSTGA